MKKSVIIVILAVVILSGILGSCNIPTPEQRLGDPTPDLNVILTQIAEEQAAPTEPAETILLTDPTEISVPTAEPTPEPTTVPKKVETLTVCLGKEPSTLFFYDESSQAMWSVLEAIYNGPFDAGDGENTPVIFDEISIAAETVSVIRGDIIANSNNEPVELKPGTTFMPASPAAECSGTGCLTTWNAVMESADINQTVITFRLKQNLTWNDGTPLTAADSVYSMNLNGMKGINASKRAYNLTESYTALDDHTVVWRGLPGYAPDDPSEVFWTPLPAHIMNGMSLEAIRESEAVNRSPLGWGAWQITSWDAGNEIIAERNPYYTADDWSEPFFDRIVYKFYGKAGDNNLQAMLSGTCDIIDTSVDLQSELEQVIEDVRDGHEAVYIRPELTRQEIVLNLDPNRAGAQDLLANVDLRNAIAQCIDRNAINRELLMGQSEIPVDFYPEGHSGHLSTLAAEQTYAPEAAQQTLDELGWTVPETGESAVRTATFVPGVYYGTELSFTLYTSESEAAVTAGEMIRKNLAQCGIGITLESLPLGELYAQGPDGVIFGRGFDLAAFAWSASSDPCAVYRSDQIPNETNHWVGTNVGGYQNEDYDEACLLPERTEADARQIFAEDMPAIPLYFNISIAASNNNICGISDRIGSRSILWNMEQFSRSEERCAVSQWNNIYN